MDMKIAQVHVGHAIEKKRNELGISKSELARRIGVPQQHINRMLEKESIDTDRLYKVSVALDYNFFALFCPIQHQISAVLAAVTLDGDANNIIGDAEIAAQLSTTEAELAGEKKSVSLLKEQRDDMKRQIDDLREQISRLVANLKDKDAIIELLKERRQ